MTHAVLALYILCLASGVALIVLSLFISQRFALRSFRDFGLLFVAATLILIAEALKTYERAISTDAGHGLYIVTTVMVFLGNGGLAWLLPLVAFEIVRREQSPARRLVNAALAAALAVIGGMKEVASGWLDSSDLALWLWSFNAAAFLGVHVYGATILLSSFGRIENAWLRRIIRNFLIFFGVFAILGLAQIVVENIPSAPEPLRLYPLEAMVYYEVFVVFALIYLGRYFMEPARDQRIELPVEFVRRFGISNRESDIIMMMLQGFSNNAIAEKLYISTLTVKNHVYHIYQKTGVRNKIQLINIMNSLK